MPVREIIKANTDVLHGAESGVLRTSFTPVQGVTDEILAIIADLKDTLHSDSLSVGLAAPQIGHKEAILVINLDETADDKVFLNPKILQLTGKKDKKFESCMSIPHKRGLVERRKKILIEYMNVLGEIHNYEASGFEARVLQHEIDHLNGILYTDRMSEVDSLEETDLFREHGII